MKLGEEKRKDHKIGMIKLLEMVTALSLGVYIERILGR